MSKPLRRTQAERRSESERALLNAAIELIAARGVGAVTFESLGRVGGFSRGLASAHFGSKANLIDSLLRNLHNRQEAMLADQGFDECNGLDALLGYVDRCLRDMAGRKEARAYYMLLSSSVADLGELRSAFADTHEVVRGRLEGWVRAGQEDGTIHGGLDPADAGLMIGCLMFGMSMQLLVDPDIRFESLRESTLSLLRTSLEAKLVVDQERNAR